MTAQSLPEKIAYRLRRDILRGKLPPGAPIKERDFAAEEDVSRMPVREAIRILAQEGLVMLRPSRSPIVAQPSFKEVADQTEVLIALEKLSAELACRHASDADIGHLAEITDQIAAQFDHMDPLDMFELDMSFHRAIAVASGNRALAATHSSYLARLWRIRYLAASQRRNRERVVTEHRRIVAAVRNRDPGAARDAVDNHLWHLAEDIRELIEAEGPNADATADPARRQGQASSTPDQRPPPPPPDGRAARNR